MQKTKILAEKPYIFVISGNHEKAKGNPIPYTRTTQRAKWSKKYNRYTGWKSYVQKCFEDHTGIQCNKYNMLEIPHKVHLSIMIYFANNKHADPDNIFKGIADALFENDKYLSGDFDYKYAPKDPRVECSLIFYKK